MISFHLERKVRSENKKQDVIGKLENEKKIKKAKCISSLHSLPIWLPCRYTPSPLYRSSHCIDLFLDPYDILHMHCLPDVYIINEVKGYFHFRFC